MKQKFLRFMQTRAGGDQLGIALLVLGMVISFAASIFNLKWLSPIGLIPMIITIIRMFSSNVVKRRSENYKFMMWWGKVTSWFKKKHAHIKGMKQYRYFKCPKCGQGVRIPRGKGKVNITCPKCAEKFVRKA